MDEFVILDDDQPHKINKKEFSAATFLETPYVQRGPGGEKQYFAQCPLCRNPIQIVGLFSKRVRDEASFSTRELKPYGKHTGKDIGGFPAFQFELFFAAHSPSIAEGLGGVSGVLFFLPLVLDVNRNNLIGHIAYRSYKVRITPKKWFPVER